MTLFHTPDTPDMAGVIMSISQVYNIINLSLFLGIVLVGFAFAILGVLIFKEVINYFM